MEKERIIAKELSKKFRIGYSKKKSALGHVVSLFSGVESKKDFWALNSISFSVKERESIGIIGKNGSGKSTLLRIIAGVYKSTKGEIKTSGKLIFLSGLSGGLKTRLTVRDNVYLVGSLLGLSQKYIRDKLDSIAEFAGLQNFVDTKIYQLSSGMKQRLAFSIVICCIDYFKPDILLLDEVFRGEVDEEFKNKSLGKIGEFMSGGTSVVLASHQLDIIEKYYDRVIWLDKGRIVRDGDPKEILGEYAK